jgi:hypothetical protein
VAKLHRVKYIVVESNFGDGMFTELLKAACSEVRLPLHGRGDSPQRAEGARICDTLEPVMNQHRLVVDRKLVDEDYRSTEDAGEARLLPDEPHHPREGRPAPRRPHRRARHARGLLGAAPGQDTGTSRAGRGGGGPARELLRFEEHVFGRLRGTGLNWNSYCLDS